MGDTTSITTKNQRTLQARLYTIHHAIGLKHMVWAMTWVFGFWLIIGHGFWLGWQYGIHTLSPADIIFIPYSEKIFITAALIALLAGGLLIALRVIQCSLGEFTLVNVFTSTSPKTAHRKQMGKSHV